MTEFYLIALAVLLTCVLLKGLAQPARMYEYPYFMSAVFFAFIGPQAIALVRFPAGASPYAVQTVLLMTLLSVIACVVGYQGPGARWIIEATQVELDDRRLFRSGVFLTVVGIGFGLLIGRMTDVQRGGSQWSGLVTIYQFFASLTYPGFSICLRHALRHRNASAWIWTILAAWIPIVSGLVYARREPVVLFAMTIALTLYFNRRIVLPRILFVAAILIALVGIPATGQYRSTLTKRGTSTALTQIDFVREFKRFLSQPTVLELRNAAMLIEVTTRSGEYRLGRGYWDEVVFRFVPAQLLGKKFKDGLMFNPGEKERQEQEFSTLGYKAVMGTTLTGVGDSFREFGYAGALVFAAMAIVFKSLWQSGLRRDAVYPQLLYIQTCTSGMLAITHQTVNYLPGLIYNLIFIGAAVYYARKHSPPVAASRAAPSLR